MVNKIYVAVSLPGLRLNCLEAWLIHTNYASKPCWFPASAMLDAPCVSQASIRQTGSFPLSLCWTSNPGNSRVP